MQQRGYSECNERTGKMLTEDPSDVDKGRHHEEGMLQL